jgi:hypothetical protein
MGHFGALLQNTGAVPMLYLVKIIVNLSQNVISQTSHDTSDALMPPKNPLLKAYALRPYSAALGVRWLRPNYRP